MTYFSEYIKSILSVGLCAFLCENVSLRLSKNTAMSRGMKLLTGLCIFTVSILPFFSLFNGGFTSLFDFSASNVRINSENSFITLTENELEKSFEEQILKETGIQTRSLSIKIEYNNNVIDIKSINATVEKVENIPIIKEYISKCFESNSGVQITVKKHEQG